MGVYSRSKQNYNLNKQFRANDGTVWDFQDSLIFWLKASANNTLVNAALPKRTITVAGSGVFSSTPGPKKAKFPFGGLKFTNKYATVAAGQAADSGDAKSIIFSFWFKLKTYTSSLNVDDS